MARDDVAAPGHRAVVPVDRVPCLQQLATSADRVVFANTENEK